MKLRGSLSVIFALMLTGVFAMSGVCLEYARGQAVGAGVQAAVTAGAESVLAGYHAPLWEEYALPGRLLPEDGLAGLADTAADYAGEWGRSGRKRGTLAGFAVREAEWSGVLCLTDGGGVIYRNLASAAMETSAAEVAADLLTKLGLEGSGSAAGILSEYAGKGKLSAGDILKGYGELKKAMKDTADQQEKEAEEAAGEPPAEETEEEAKARRKSEKEAKKARQEEREKGKRFLDFLEEIKSVFRTGLLRSVLPPGTEISSAEVPAGLVSGGSGAGASGIRDGNAILFREYLMRHMTAFHSDSGHVPAYETEYLISGKGSDEANLSGAVNRIFGMRFAMDFLYLSADAVKKGEAAEAALLAAGWTGQPVLVEIVTQLLLAAWAAAEAFGDVKMLMKEEKIPLVKTDSDWRLSLESAVTDLGEGAAGVSSERGLSYEDYLRICLYFSGKGKLSSRAMDVTEWNVKKLDPAFRMSQCLEEGTLTIWAETGMLFAPLHGTLTGAKKKMRRYERSSRCSYLREFP